MKYFFSPVVLALILVSFLPFSAVHAQETEAQPLELVRIDRNHSTLGFNVPIVNGLSKVTGKFTDFSVDLYWDPERLDSSSVGIVIQVESIDTGIGNRNNHLKSADFFDVAVYPTITFTSHSIRPEEDHDPEADHYVVDGTFSMHGVTKEISVPMVARQFVSPDGHAWTSFTVKYVLDRTDYGMNWKHSIADFFVGDEIETDIVLLTR